MLLNANKFATSYANNTLRVNHHPLLYFLNRPKDLGVAGEVPYAPFLVFLAVNHLAE